MDGTSWRMPRDPGWVDLAGGLICVAVIALLDFFAGADWSLLFLYAVIIGVVAWRVGWRWSLPHITIALVGTAVADALGEGAHSVTLAAWNSVTRVVFFVGGAWLLSKFRDSLDNEYRHARTDALTGAFNRHAFEERAELELARARRSPMPISVAFFDLDGLKEVNDRYGHEAGDALLQAFVQAAAPHIRATDALARLGGDEFVALLPGADRSEAVLVVDRVVAEFDFARPHTGAASLSVGLVVWETAPPDSVRELVTVADAVMYKAKRGGGAQVLTLVAS